MSTLVIDLTHDPLQTEPRNGERVAFLVEGIVRRVEDDLVDVTGHSDRREYLHGSREIEVAVTRLLRQPVPVEFVQ